MKTADVFRFDHRRHLAATAVRPEHHADFNRLVKVLRYGSRFQFLLAECNDDLYRDLLIAKLNDVLAEEGMQAARLNVSRQTYSNFAALETEMRRLAADHQALHIVDQHHWFDAEQLEAFNIRREAVAQVVPIRLIFWLATDTIKLLALQATDLWTWRGGVFSFATQGHMEISEPPQFMNDIDNRTQAQRSKRIAELHSYLNMQPPLPDDLILPLFDELAGLLKSLGDFDEALRIRREDALPRYRKMGDEHAVATSLANIADILTRQGKYEEALNIQKEELSIHQKFNDHSALARCLGNIATNYSYLKLFDFAQSMFQKQVLPIFQELKDDRSIAVTQGKIAQILCEKGQLTEALQVLQKDVLPIFRKLSDINSVAITYGQIADIFCAQGQFSEAMHIRQEQELPVYRKLGDAHLVAITQGDIAAILQATGQYAEAAHILEDEAIPALLKIGDERSMAILRTRLEEIRQAMELPRTEEPA
jgi:tetratricopeptide (TPR) repeat protein